MIAPRYWPNVAFWLLQFTPPVAIFGVLFGKWNIGVALIAGLLIVYSIFQLITRIRRRESRTLTRPLLTLLLLVVILVMGNFYARGSAAYALGIGQQLNAQCNLDMSCRIPGGQWTRLNGSVNQFRAQTPGLVGFPVEIRFDVSKQGDTYTRFRIVRMLEDFPFEVSGGVGLPVTIHDGSKERN